MFKNLLIIITTIMLFSCQTKSDDIKPSPTIISREQFKDWNGIENKSSEFDKKSFEERKKIFDFFAFNIRIDTHCTGLLFYENARKLESPLICMKDKPIINKDATKIELHFVTSFDEIKFSDFLKLFNSYSDKQKKIFIQEQFNEFILKLGMWKDPDKEHFNRGIINLIQPPQKFKYAMQTIKDRIIVMVDFTYNTDNTFRVTLDTHTN